MAMPGSPAVVSDDPLNGAVLPAQYDALFGWSQILTAVRSQLARIISIPEIVSLVTAYYHSTPPGLEWYATGRVACSSYDQLIALPGAFVSGPNALSALRTNGLYVSPVGTNGAYSAYRFLRSSANGVVAAYSLITPASGMSSVAALTKSVVGVCNWLGKPNDSPLKSAHKVRALPGAVEPIGQSVRRLASGLESMCAMIASPVLAGPGIDAVIAHPLLLAPNRFCIVRSNDLRLMAVSGDGEWLQFFAVIGSRVVTGTATNSGGSGGSGDGAADPLGVEVGTRYRFVAKPKGNPLTAKRWVK